MFKKSFGKAGSAASKQPSKTSVLNNLCPPSSHFQKTNRSVCKCDICLELLLLWKESLEVVSRLEEEKVGKQMCQSQTRDSSQGMMGAGKSQT